MLIKLTFPIIAFISILFFCMMRKEKIDTIKVYRTLKKIQSRIMHLTMMTRTNITTNEEKLTRDFRVSKDNISYTRMILRMYFSPIKESACFYVISCYCMA